MADLSRIEILVLDVDGVLTDGTLYVGDDGSTFKRYAIIDGAGIKYFVRAGFKVAIISGHASDTVRHRFESLGVTDVQVGVVDKLGALLEVLGRHDLEPGQVAAMGDDVMDLPMLRASGFRVTVPGAHPRVREEADHVTTRKGGHGAVREVIEMILESKGMLDVFLEGGVA